MPNVIQAMWRNYLTILPIQRNRKVDSPTLVALFNPFGLESPVQRRVNSILPLPIKNGMRLAKQLIGESCNDEPSDDMAKRQLFGEGHGVPDTRAI